MYVNLICCIDYGPANTYVDIKIMTNVWMINLTHNNTRFD